jgi:hypothetical protein
VIAHVSATHGVAVLSMPALGPVSVRKRTAETIVRLVGHMLGDLAPTADAAPPAQAVTRRMRELGGRTERGEHGVGFVARVITGNIWLLLGMLRANRPWRLALRLMRVLAVAFAAGVFALVTSDIWRLSHYLGPLRLTVIALGSVAAIIVTIMVSTGLWERSPHPAAREQVALFNIVTAATVGLGVAALYLALFIAMLAAALLLVPGSLLGLVLGHSAGVADQVSLAWLATSIATVGGALGAALESGESVREAAYTHQPDTQIDAVAGPRLRAAGSRGLSLRRAATVAASADDRGSGPPRRRVPTIRAGRGGCRAAGRAAAARCARSPRRCPAGRRADGRRPARRAAAARTVPGARPARGRKRCPGGPGARIARPAAVEVDALQLASPQRFDRVRDHVQDGGLAVLLGQQHGQHEQAPQRGELFTFRAVVVASTGRSHRLTPHPGHAAGKKRRRLSVTGNRAVHDSRSRCHAFLLVNSILDLRFPEENAPRKHLIGGALPGCVM